ncbi:MAG: histidine--tRNA ligase, partial [Candidatus Aenigmarchaeota archaeon]|nr:histidine--tRNA ligase [Candidatus Aenigmarchaeota archaeon]
LKPLKGTRDFLPEEMIIRQKILDRIKNTFEIFGFQPLETPAIESWEILSAKGAGGEEILRETYNFEDLGKRRIGLRYDLTVPLARVIASNPNLPLPFKRYQIQNVWRYGDVSKGRLREFLQADIDIVGSKSMLADAEVIACAVSCLNSLGFKDFLVRINNRKILSALIKFAGVEEEKAVEVFRSIDKLEKIGEENVKKELEEKGIPKDSIKKIFDFIKIDETPEKIFDKIEDLRFDEGKEGIEELKDIVFYLKQMKVDVNIKIDLSLARGLDYYTGPIFEISAEKEIGSIAGGGRYDNLIGVFAKKEIPATGISLGIERIIEVMKKRKMIEKKKVKTEVFVVTVNKEILKKSLPIIQSLREIGIKTDYDLRERNLTKQLEYANSLGIPFVLIIGEKELEEKKFKLRFMEKRIEKELSLEEVIQVLRENR